MFFFHPTRPKHREIKNGKTKNKKKKQKTKKLGHGTAATNPWVDQCAALKLDTFTLVTVTLNALVDFEKLTFTQKLIKLRKFHTNYFSKRQK